MVTGAQQRARYGVPAMVNGGDVLRRLGLRGTVHPDDVAASLYPSREAADAFAASNLENHGYPDLGSFVTDGGVVGVTDLRLALPSPTDPAKPDGPHEASRTAVPLGGA